MGRHVTFHVHSTIPFIEAGTIVCVCVWGIYIPYYIHPYAILYISVCFLLSRVLRQDFYGIAQSKKKKEMKEIPTFPDLPKRLYVRAFVRTRSNGEIERKKKN